MKKWSTSLAIKEMQIKTTSRFHCTPVRIAIIKAQTTNIGKDVGIKDVWKILWRLLKKPDWAMPLLLEIYSRECKSGYNKDTRITIFMAALFKIAKLWKQPRCPATDKWIKIVWYLYAMEFIEP
jgi:hypothetical protein